MEIAFSSAIQELANTLPDTDYVWQAQLDYRQYSKIKALVESVFRKYDSNQIQADSSFTSFKKVIKYFIAEWYKREYCGGLAISPSIPTSISAAVVDHFGIDHVPVNIRTQWQSCIRALGGLPVFSLLEKHKSERNDQLINKLSSLFDPEESQDFDATEDLFNDKTINRSESIRRLIPLLQDGWFPYAEEDKVNDHSSWTFKDFSEILKSGFEQNKKRKFSIEYRFWKMPGFASKLSTCIRFKPNAVGDGRNVAINEDRLKSWGIDSAALNQFTLQFECGGQSLSVPFFKCINKDWIPYKCESVIETDFPLFEDIHIKLDGVDLPLVESPSRKKGCVQLYSDDHRSWSSRGGCGRYSLVVFNRSLWRSPDSQSIEDTEFEFVELVDGKCELSPIGGGPSLLFYNAEGRLSVKPQKPLFQEGWFINRQESRFPCKIAGQEDLVNVYVVDHSGFDVGVIKINGERSSVNNDEYRIEHFDRDSARYVLLDSLEELKGFHSLRIKTYEKTAEILCFFVDSGTSVKRNMSRNSREGAIELNGFDCFNVSIGGGAPVKINNNNKISCNYNITRESSGCQIEVADNNGNKLLLDVVWPYDMTDILQEDESRVRLYKPDQKKSSSVPAILADRFIHRVFSSEGCTRSTVSEDKRFEINSYIHKQLLTENEGQISTPKTFNGYASISLYSKKLERDDMYSFIVDSGNEISESIKNLKFCFVPIDDGEMVDIPMKIIDNDDYRGKKKYLILDIPHEIDDARGLIIQSLNETQTEEYYRATYKPSQNEPDRMNEKEKNLKRLETKEKYTTLFFAENADLKIAIRAFNIANELGCYYGWFDELKILCLYDVSFERRMVCFFKQYLDDCLVRQTAINYPGLWRFSGEFMFDWMLIPARYWRDLIEICKDYSVYIHKLFLARPGLRGAAIYQTERISSLIASETLFAFRRSDEVGNKVAQCIRREKKDIAQIEYPGKKRASETFLSEKDKISIFKNLTDFSFLMEVYDILIYRNTKTK